MEGPDTHTGVTPSSGSYFDRVLDRCRSYKQSLDQLLEEVDNEIDNIVSAGAESDLAADVEVLLRENVVDDALIPPNRALLGSTMASDLVVLGGTQAPPDRPLAAVPKNRQMMARRGGGHLTSILTSAYVLSGRYELVKCITTTGCGILFKALDRRKLLFDEKSPYVAIEVLSNDFQKIAAWQTQLQREATRLTALTHPNIAPTVDVERDGATVYVVMEYLRGVSLQEKLQQLPHSQLPPKDCIKVILDVGHALDHAHSCGVTHGDLRLSNILIGPTGSASVFDFGIAGLIAAGQWNKDDRTDLAFLSPNLGPGSEPDALDDVYSYACICYLLLTGSHPYDWRDSKTATQLGLSVPRGELNWVQWKALQRALNFDRNKRTTSIAQVMSEVTSVNFNPLVLSRVAGWSGLDWLLRRNRHAHEQTDSTTRITPALEHKVEPSSTSEGSEHLSKW